MNNAVENVLDRYWDHLLPVDPFKIAAEWGARVEPLEENAAFNNQGVSGIAVIKNGVHRIYYNQHEHGNRQRFTVAHELAHHVLGHTKDGEYHRDNVQNYMTTAPLIQERQANQFAAALLMPEKAIMHYVTREGVDSTFELAKIFNVSEAAMRWRLKEIGFFD